MFDNEPKWIDVEATGEVTKHKYMGRFKLKPYLTLGERADAVRLAENYCRGIVTAIDQRDFLTTLAFLNFHVVETDADWWKDEKKFQLLDEAPVYSLSRKVRELQNPEKKKDDEKKD